MVYAYRLEKKDERTNRDLLVDDLLYVLDPKRWERMNLFKTASDTLKDNIQSTEQEINEVSVLDTYFENLGQKKSMSGADLVFKGEWV